MLRELTALYELELEDLSRLPNRTVATIASAHFCTRRKIPLPLALASEMAQQLARANSDDRESKKGRRANDLASYRQDHVDFMRWDTVKEVREKQREFRQELETLQKARDIPEAILEEKHKMSRWLGKSLVRAFECASMILRGTTAHSGPDAIKRSYFIVENSNDPSKYRVLDPATLDAVGLGDSWFYRHSKKLTPLYDLTL